MLAQMRFGPVEQEPYLDSRSRAAEEHERYRRKQAALVRWYLRHQQQERRSR